MEVFMEVDMARGIKVGWPGYYGARRSICISLGRPQVVRKAQYDPRRARSEKQFLCDEDTCDVAESGKMNRIQCVDAQVHSSKIAHTFMGINAGWRVKGRRP